MESTYNNQDFEEKLQKLECPFTWLMDDLNQSIDTNYSPHDEEKIIPLVELMRIIMTVYVQTKEKANFIDIFKNLEKSDEILCCIQENAQVSKKIITYITKAVKCFAYWKYNNKNHANKIFDDIKDFKAINKIERSTLYACKSICWSIYHHIGSEESIKFIKLALENNSNYDLWYFILGKNLRRIRRDSSVGSIPTDEEANAFLTAYSMSRNSLYGIFVAQMYREQRQPDKALKLYQEIYNKKPESATVLLRLALGFITLFKLSEAKKCLDEVASKGQEDCMYLHYRGIYHMKSKNIQKATYYLKKAADMGNILAAKQYLRFIVKSNPRFDTTGYLLSLLDKCKELPERQNQNLLLDIAFSYLKQKNIKQTLKYLLLSIDIDPKNLSLTEYFSIFEPGKKQNVYNILATEVFPLIESNEPLDENTWIMYNDLKSYHEEYIKNQSLSIQKAFSNIVNF